MMIAVKNNIDTNRRKFPNLEMEQNLGWRSRDFQASKILVIIDSKVTNPRILAAGVVSGAEVKILDPHRDGVTQITEIVGETSSVHSLHIVAHGSPGCLYLGNSELSLDTLANYSAIVQTWFVPSILLYSCNVAQGDAGAEFLSKLQHLTQAQIQASTTKVGNLEQGGNWELDVAVGGGSELTNTEIAFNQATQDSYSGIFANDNPFPRQFNLSALNGSNGFAINGINAGDRSAISVSNAGDINGDGIDDLIIGAYGADPNGIRDAGQSYVVFGGIDVGSSGTLELSDLDGSNGFVLNGINGDNFSGDYSGRSVSNAGDINGDGIDDLIIGAYGADPNGIRDAGQSYVVFGGIDVGSSGTLELSDLNGSNGFTINGIDEDDFAGISVINAGDVNNDGIDDVIIGSVNVDSNGNSDVGQSYVVFGSIDVGSSGTLELSDLDGSNGFAINSIDFDEENRFSLSASNAGDINGDGIDDFIIGAGIADTNANNSGQSYVIFGGIDVGSSGTLELSDLDGSNGFTINGINLFDFSGSTLSNAGDVNNDGIDDFIIGALQADPNGNGAAGQNYVIFGGTDVGSSGTLELSDLDGSNGFTINGTNRGDTSGRSLSNAGDINNDGIDDLIIGASGADPNGNDGAGQSYVIFGGTDIGSSGTLELSDLDGNNGFVFNGIDINGFLGRSVSNAGDINNDGIDDLILDAFQANPNGKDLAGQSYVIFGGTNLIYNGPNTRIQAEDYVDYHDTTPGNIGGAYRNDDVDIELSQDFDNGFSVGWIEQGEWLTYDINVPEDGVYQIVGRVASDLDRAHSLDISLDGQTTQLNFGDTGGWYSWENVAGDNLQLTAGQHTLRVDMGSSGFNFNYLDLVPSGNIRVQAEDYADYQDATTGNIGGAYRNDDVDIEVSQDFDNGFSVGWIEQGEWLTYDINVPEDGFYQVVGRVASDLDQDHRLDISLDGQTTELKFGDTGGWYSWENVAGGGLNLTAGNHTLRLDMASSGFNLNYVDLVPANNIRIEAEDYVDYHDTTPGNIGGAYRNDDVDIEVSQDFDNGFSVGWIEQGEWLTYDINVPKDGVYQIVGRVASDLDLAHSLDVSLDGQTTELSFGDTGGWYSWEDVVGDGLHLTAGNHTLRLDMASSGFNVNYIDLIADS